LAGVIADKIDVMATDHAPHTIEEKMNTYFKAPSGGPLVQHALVAAMEMVKQGKISIKRLLKRCATIQPFCLVLLTAVSSERVITLIWSWLIQISTGLLIIQIYYINVNGHLLKVNGFIPR
jgi:hypothetical protein